MVLNTSFNVKGQRSSNARRSARDVSRHGHEFLFWETRWSALGLTVPFQYDDGRGTSALVREADVDASHSERWARSSRRA